MSSHKILLFYKYTKIPEPVQEQKYQLALGKDLNLKGRVLIGSEGINGTLEGTNENVQKYQDYLNNKPGFENIHWKVSPSNGDNFPRWSVKIKTEVVVTKAASELDPTRITGKYLQAEELHEWFESGKEFYIVDMRNDYEHEVGHFRDSILADFQNFRDLPKILKQIDHLKDKTIVTVCTGGIRCEKASGFLVENGFENVYQLYGGIVTYMEKFPNQNYLGKLYVFDNRIIMGFNTEDSSHQVIGKCLLCTAQSEHYVDARMPNGKRKHTIICPECVDKNRLEWEILLRGEKEKADSFVYKKIGQ